PHLARPRRGRRAGGARQRALRAGVALPVAGGAGLGPAGGPLPGRRAGRLAGGGDRRPDPPGPGAQPAVVARPGAPPAQRRAGGPCVRVSPSRSRGARAWGRLVAPARADEGPGWPVVEIVDLTRQDRVRSGPWSPALVRLLRSGARVACVLNRTGRAALLAG